jgi:trk system potassium uptake protein TrkH
MAAGAILYITSQMLRILGLLFLAPTLIALIYGETSYAVMFFFIALGLFVPFTIAHMSLKGQSPKIRHAIAAIAFTWFMFALVGAIPLWFHGFSFIDGLFESMSGWSGTGLSILSDPSTQPYSINFWRCFMQWAGGLGVVVMALLVLERPETAEMLFAAEGRTEDFTLNLYAIGRTILGIYLVLTFAGIALFLLAGLPPFEALITTFTTLSTGGFSSNAVGVGAFGQGAMLVAMLVMLAGGISFVSHKDLIEGNARRFFANPEIRFLLTLVGIASALIAFDFYHNGQSQYFDGVFYAISAITGTGNTGPVAVSSFPQMTISVLIMLMIFGACYGSTTSALKLWRVILLYKVTLRDIRRHFLPRGAQIPLKVNRVAISPQSALQVSAYVFIYFAFLVLGSMAFMVAGYPSLDAVFTVASAQGNVGLSLVDVPGLPGLLKVLLTFHMFIGRIEIIPLLVFVQGVLKLKRI